MLMQRITPYSDRAQFRAQELARARDRIDRARQRLLDAQTKLTSLTANLNLPFPADSTAPAHGAHLTHPERHCQTIPPSPP